MNYNERASLIAGIAVTIQRVYGDATSTALDMKAAEEIWKYLQSRGVVPLSGVATLVAAAGGQIAITEDLMIDPPTEVKTWDDMATRTRKFAVKMP